MELSHETIYSSFIERFEKINAKRHIKELFRRISEKTDQWAIVGGFVRDAALELPFNDVDIVVDLDRISLWKAIGTPKQIEMTAFGGYRVKVDGIFFDLWSAENSWAFQENLLEYKGLESFINMINYNADAIMACPTLGKVYSNRFIECFKNNVLEIMFASHPFPKYIKRKGFKLARKYSLEFSEETERFLIS